VRAVGFVAKTGSAVAVVLSLEPEPILVERCTLTLTPPGVERFVYHAAKLEPGGAAEYVRDSARQIERHTKAEMEGLFAVAGPIGAAAIVGATLELPGTTEEIIAAHPKMHTAEGVLFRAAIADAVTALGVTPALVPAAELAGNTWVLDALGKVPSPWRKEHKQATLAAAVVAAGGRGDAPA
jgi:hypothetical protein